MSESQAQSIQFIHSPDEYGQRLLCMPCGRDTQSARHVVLEDKHMMIALGDYGEQAVEPCVFKTYGSIGYGVMVSGVNHDGSFFYQMVHVGLADFVNIQSGKCQASHENGNKEHGGNLSCK